MRGTKGRLQERPGARKLRNKTMARKLGEIPGRYGCEFAGNYFFFDDFLALLFFDADFFFGTFAPALRASDNPIAIACLRLVTFLPLRPLLSLPVFFSRITRATFFCAFGPYFLPDDFFFAAMQHSPFLYWEAARDVQVAPESGRG
ncbi:MAG TPA: hypothetical protein VHE33_17300 [Acidobacteriaceae bacterium]|nr:hypothetical protein [Acidobacteriaceae bacterium]